MELRHLRYFVAVVEQKGFREASRKLHVAQSSISLTISSLEQEMSVKLFQRDGRSVQLTPQGDVFYRETLRTLEQTERATEAAQRAARGEIGVLTLGFCSVATYAFLPALVKQYKRSFPGIRLVFREMTPPQQEIAFEQRRIDVGITRPPFKDSLADRLNTKTLAREPLVVALPESHSFTGACMRLEDLAAEPLILYYRDGAPNVFDGILSLFHSSGLTPHIEYEADIMQTALTLVAAEQGVAILPMCALNLKSDGVRFCGLRPDSYRAELVIAWPKASESPALQAFLQLISKSRKDIESYSRQTQPR